MTPLYNIQEAQQCVGINNEINDMSGFYFVNLQLAHSSKFQIDSKPIPSQLHNDTHWLIPPKAHELSPRIFFAEVHYESKTVKHNH